MPFVNRCWFRAASSGSGTFTVSSAITGYLTPAQADAVNGALYSYVAESNDLTEWEVGYGIYTASGTTLSRLVLKSSNSNSAVSFTAAPKVALTALAADVYRPPLRGHISGLILSNNASDANNDLDFAVGEATDSTGNVVMRLQSAYTKRIDASWAVGTGNGGLFSGTVANTTWYYPFLIMRPDTGVVDAGFDTSIIAANRPSDYTFFRRLGAFRTNGSAAIYGFRQTGDYFDWNTPFGDVSANAAGTSAVLRALTVPPGLKLLAHVTIRSTFGASGQAVVVTDPDTPDIVPGGANAQLSTGLANGSVSVVDWVRTDTSAQIRTRQAQGGASETLSMNTFGWVDPRGKDG